MLGILVDIVILIVGYVLNKLLTPVQPTRDPGQFAAPTCAVGVSIPAFYGTVEIAPNATWFGNVQKIVDDVYYQYNANMMCVFGWGLVNELLDLKFAGKSARYFNLSSSAYGGPLGLSCMTPAPLYPRFSNADDFGNTAASSVQIDGDGDLLPSDPATLSGGTQPTVAMFGGKTQGGGPQGAVTCYFGPDGQSDDALLSTNWGATLTSGYPKLFYMVFGQSVNYPFGWTWNNPAPPAVTALVRRTSWYESATTPLGGVSEKIHYSASTWGNTITSVTGDLNLGGDANPGEILYDLLTNAVYGLGLSPSLLDVPSFSAVAQELKTEVVSATKTGFGLSLIVKDTTEAAATIGQILNTIDGILSVNPLTGKLVLRLIRADYDVADLPTIDVASGTELHFTRGTWRETLNEVQITYPRLSQIPLNGTILDGSGTGYDVQFSDPAHASAEGYYLPSLFPGGQLVYAGEARTVTSSVSVGGANSGTFGLGLSSAFTTAPASASQVVFLNGEVDVSQQGSVLVQDQANYFATGSIRSQTLNFPFVTHPDIAQLIAERRLRKVAYPLATLTIKVNRAAYSLAPGDCFLFTWAPYGIADMVIRITEIDYGTLQDGTMTLTGSEDIFTVDVASFTVPPAAGWSEPTRTFSSIDPPDPYTGLVWGDDF